MVVEIGGLVLFYGSVNDACVVVEEDTLASMPYNAGLLNINGLLEADEIFRLTFYQYRVLGYATLTGPNSDLAVALEFAPKVFGASTAFKICMAMSAFGNVLAVTYTAAKGKFHCASSGNANTCNSKTIHCHPTNSSFLEIFATRREYP